MQRLSQQFVSDLTHLTAMREFVAQACHQAWGPDANEQEIAFLELALDEAIANIIRHAYQGAKDRPVELIVETNPEAALVWVYHEGKSFDPALVPPPSFDGSREGGFGLYLIEQAVEDVTYLKDDQGRCGIRLLKRRNLSRQPENLTMTDLEVVGDVAIIGINLEHVDAGNSEDLKEAISPVLDSHDKVVLDLSRVKFVDSRGCGIILSCLKKLTAKGGDLHLCCIHSRVRTVFELIRLNRLCEFTDTREQAVAAFNKA